MSEGELKKRFLASGYDFYPEGSVENNEDPDWLNADTVFETLLEAQKDFPNIDDKKYGSDTTPWIPWNYSAFNRDLLDWKVKWFGSAQP